LVFRGRAALDESPLDAGTILIPRTAN